MAFVIIFCTFMICDCLCYVHGHKSYLFGATKDYEKRILEKLRK